MSILSKDAYGRDLGQVVGRFGTTHTHYANGTSWATPTFSQGTSLVRVAVGGSGGHVYFAIGANPTAVDDTGPAIPYGTVEFFAVKDTE